MSVTDRAFIRAYSAGGREHVAPRPHLPLEAERRQPLRDAAHLPLRGEPDEEAALEAPPLAHRMEHAAASAATEPAAFQAARRVEQFTWPEACRRLLALRGEEFQALAHKLETAAACGQSLIALASAYHGQGCTTALLCIAHCLSQRRVRAVLVDANFHHPDLAARLGMPVPAGWEAVMRGRAELEEAMILSDRDGLALLPLRAERRTAQLLARNPRARTTLAALAGHYDVVLIDAGQVLSPDATVGPVLQPSRPVKTLLVHDARNTAPGELAEAADRLASAGLEVLAAAENFAA